MRTLFGILLSIVSLTARGQQKDYLVKQNGDTLYGNIVVKNGQFTVNVIGLETVIVDAEDVKELKSSDYKGTVVLPCRLHTYSDNLETLEKYYYQSIDIDTVLILSEVYSTPKMNLYWCKDDFGQQYYFYKTPANGLPVQLYVNYALGGGLMASFERNVWGRDSQVHLEVQKGYVNQLRFVMQDCSNISEEMWEMLDYRIYSLKQLIKRYNSCR